MERYPDISDHGLIGDLQMAALVAADGTVDWLCCPRFDSPGVEIGASGERLGIFPQAFSHPALISAAVNLDHQLDHGDGAVAGAIGRRWH